MHPVFYEIFEALPRQGPGDDESTRKAFRVLSGLPVRPDILDVGCGTGRQTLVLAELSKGTIIALDNHEPFVNTLRRSVERLGLGDRVRAVVGDMNSMSFPESSFDVIWCEGAAFIMGFANALTAWRPLLRPNGYVVISELVWFAEDAPQEIRDFFAPVCPDMKQWEQLYPVIESAGYRVADYFPFPDSSWWTHYYTPAEKKIAELKSKHAGNSEANAVLDMLLLEIEMHRKYSPYYGYGFYIMRKETS